MEKTYISLTRYFIGHLTLFLCITLTACQDVVYNLTEGMPENTYLGNVAENSNLQSRLANPTDIQSVTYSFINNEFVPLFHINERESSLYTSKVVDREELCEYKPECTIILEVIAKCKSSSCYEKLIVKINVLDINDNYPTFSKQKLDLEFSEGSLFGTSVPIEAAVDLDTGIFSIQNYTTEQILPPPSSISEPYFVIKLQEFGDTTIVSVSLNKTLDREKQDHFIIRVLAFDGGNPPKSGSIDLNITVTDINDNVPIFTRKNYTISIDENVPINSTIISVYARDPDLGQNGEVLYRLSPNQDDDIHSLFDINESTGEIKVIASLMNGPIENYKIIVWASDKAAQPLTSQTNIYVHVRDVVNSPPQINVNLLSQAPVAEISEAAAVDAAVAHIKVSDPDKGPNGMLTCSVISDKFKLQTFDMNDYEYKVVVAKPLNRELVDQHSVTVICFDAGSPPQNASARFFVQVLDENDNSPVFSQSTYYVNFPENNQIGAQVVKVTASDFDSGKNAEIRYEIDETDSKYFTIDTASGLITSKIVLDRENTSRITFPVYCKDGGSTANTATANVVIQVTDVNDNAPKFSDSDPVFSVPENFDRIVKLGELRATDKDIGKNKVVSFAIKEGQSVPFKLFSNGTLFSAGTLDREHSSKYEFEVVATDGGKPSLSSIAKVTVFVLDENDNPPEFVFPNSKNNTVVMSYQTPPNTIITTINTVDKDDSLNSKVTYFVRGDNEISEIFQLNSLSGRLILMKHLTVADAKRYTFAIIAQDKGTPPRISERTMNVVITTQKLDGRVTANLQDVHKEYFLIAVAITCVTVVLAVVIVIAIFLIRRADRLKKMCNNNGSHDNKNDLKKKVSFSAKNAIITAIPPKHQGHQQQLQTNLYEIQGQNQVIQTTYPLMFDKLEVSELNKSNKPQSLNLHENLLIDGRKYNTPVTTTKTGSTKRVDCDNHSDLSGEATTIDSGRGGSEDDLNNSTLLSYSAEFGDVKCSSPRTVTNSSFSFPRRNPHTDQTENKRDFRESNNLYRVPVRPVSFSDKFFNFENSSVGIYPKNYSGFSPTGNSSICTGHDDSTTTSGSYTIDEEDEYVEVVQRSKQCIV